MCTHNEVLEYASYSIHVTYNLTHAEALIIYFRKLMELRFFLSLNKKNVNIQVRKSQLISISHVYREFVCVNGTIRKSKFFETHWYEIEIFKQEVINNLTSDGSIYFLLKFR